MYDLKVGGLLIPNKTFWQEGTFLEYTESGPILIFALNNLTETEIEGAKKGQIELAIYASDPVLWFLHKIKGLEDWSDTPFSIRLYDDKGITFDWSEPIEEGKGVGLQIVLVDAATGVIKALRLIGMPTKFSKEFRQAILGQLEVPFSKEEYDSAIQYVYRNLRTKDLLARANYKYKV